MNNEFIENADFRLSPNQNINTMSHYSFIESRNFDDKFRRSFLIIYNDFLEYSIPKILPL